MTIFGVGLVLLAVGAVLVAVAVWRSGVLPRWSGIGYAVGFGLFLPQFFGPAPRSGSAMVRSPPTGAIILAAALWSRRREAAPEVATAVTGSAEMAGTRP